MDTPMLTMEADYEDQVRQDALIITAVVMTVIAGIFVGLRLISRCILIRTPGPDDYFILGALVLTIGYAANMSVGKVNKMGFPAYMLTLDNMVALLKMTLSIEVMYYANVFCIKTSILFTYLRFAISDTFRKLCIATIILHSVFFCICLIVTLSQCRPLEKMWDLLGVVNGSCINTTAFFYSTSGFNIITDIWILLLPIKTLNSIIRPKSEKIALFFVFGVGVFASVASIVRLFFIYTYTLATDPFRNAIQVNLWSFIEVTIAICCASVSALKPIFSRGQRKRSREATRGSQSRTSRVRRMRSRGMGSLHFRLGSKDLTISLTSTTRASHQVERDPEVGLGDAKVRSQPSTDVMTASTATRVDSWEKERTTTEPESTASSMDANSAVVYTALSPLAPTRDRNSVGLGYQRPVQG